jgi:hypothetical protein
MDISDLRLQSNTGTPITGVVEQVFGTRYAVVVDGDGHRHAVDLGMMEAAPTWHGQLAQVYAGLVGHQRVLVRPVGTDLVSGAILGDIVRLDANGDPSLVWSAEAARSGYAIPHARIISGSQYQDRVEDALREARLNKVGFWQEIGSASLLADDIAARTEPPVTLGSLPLTVAIVVGLVAMVVVAMAQSTRKGSGAPRGLIRTGLGYVVGNYREGAYRGPAPEALKDLDHRIEQVDVREAVDKPQSRQGVV